MDIVNLSFLTFYPTRRHKLAQRNSPFPQWFLQSHLYYNNKAKTTIYDIISFDIQSSVLPNITKNVWNEKQYKLLKNLHKSHNISTRLCIHIHTQKKDKPRVTPKQTNRQTNTPTHTQIFFFFTSVLLFNVFNLLKA